jgi:hypothetical protein
MRGLAILIVALVALSAMASPQPRHFTPRPTNAGSERSFLTKTPGPD